MALDSFYQTAVPSYNSVCEMKVICGTVPMDGISVDQTAVPSYNSACEIKVIRWIKTIDDIDIFFVIHRAFSFSFFLTRRSHHVPFHRPD